MYLESCVYFVVVDGIEVAERLNGQRPMYSPKTNINHSDRLQEFMLLNVQLRHWLQVLRIKERISHNLLLGNLQRPTITHVNPTPKQRIKLSIHQFPIDLT